MVRYRAAALDVLAFAVQALVFVPFAFVRFVDGDEGVYAYASRLVIHGGVPYRDFFYEQMPLLPYVYGAWIAVTGESWYSVRLLSALFAAAAGTLLFRHVRLRLGARAATIALGLYVLSGLELGYLTIVKTFALMTLLLFGAYVLAAGPSSRARLAAAGALIGLALDTRLVAAAAVPVLFASAVTRRRARVFAAGFAAAVVPSVVLLGAAPYAFVFDNLRYHGLKTSSGLVGNAHEKEQTAATLLGLEPTDRALGIQFLVLVVACAAVIVLRPSRARLALGLAAALSVASLLPTPTYVQYFAVTVPFLIVAAVELTVVARHRVGVVLVVAAVCVYAGAGAVAARQFARREALLRPSIGSVRRVAAKVDAETVPRERVLSGWAGYLFGTHADALPGYTNQFAPVAAAAISSTTARRVHVASEAELERMIRAREVALVVSRNWVTSPPFAHWESALDAGRYRLVATVETAGIYRR